MKEAVAYYRVSTDRQGETKLGLEVQQVAVAAFTNANDFRLIAEFTEIESGKRNNRPVLLAALKKCRQKKAVLLIAKLDRLSRSVAFITTLMESQVKFRAVDNPSADKPYLQLMAVFAELERDMISERTKAALKIAKAHGVELGKNGKYILAKQNKENAVAFAMKMRPVIERLKAKGKTTVRAITSELNRLNIPTFRHDGSHWHLTTVHQLLKRLNEPNETPITT